MKKLNFYSLFSFIFKEKNGKKKTPKFNFEGLFYKILFYNYWALTVTDLLFWDQAKGLEPEFTGLSFP